MNSTTETNLFKAILKNAPLSSLLLLTMLGAGIWSGSNLVLILTAVLTLARPLLYVAMISHDDEVGKSVERQFGKGSSFDRVSSIRPALNSF